MTIESFAAGGLALLAAGALAAQSVAVRLSTRTHRVETVIAAMFVLNVAVLIPLTAARYYPTFGVTPTAVAAFGIAGILGSLLARFSLFVGIKRLGASRAEPLKSIFPLFAAVGAVVVLDEQVTVALVAGMVLLVGGAAGITLESRASPVTRSQGRLWVDVSFPLVAAVLLGIDPIFTKVGLAEGTSPLVGVTTRVLAAATGFALYLGWRRWRTGSGPDLAVTRWTLAASVANTVYLVSYVAALARAPVSVVAPILGASPLFVVLAAALFIQEDERVTVRLAVAVTVVVAGVLLVLQG